MALLASAALFLSGVQLSGTTGEVHSEENSETGRTRIVRPRKTYMLMILALITPAALTGYAIIIGDWIYAVAFGLVSFVNFDLYYHSTKKEMPYTFRPLVKLESIIHKEPYDPRLEEED